MSTVNNHGTITKTTVRIVRAPIDVGNGLAKGTGTSFQKFSNGVSTRAGSPFALMIAVILVIFWAITGPFFHFSETWQLVINTGTTIVTFLMVFAIQNTQNRDSKAVQLKLDELIKSTHSARDTFLDIEDLTDAELDQLHQEFKDMHDKIQARASRIAKK